jgi:hypothetical protein
VTAADWARLALILTGPLLAGCGAGVAIDAALNLRALRRTGHTSACQPRFGCTCRGGTLSP